jgi:hypothetical protein
MQMRLRTLSWGLLATIVMCASVSAQPKKGDTKPTTTTTAKDTANKKEKVKNFDFNALDLNGRMRTPQLLYFLERANEELERASLEKRSFIPTMVKSVEEEKL